VHYRVTSNKVVSKWKPFVIRAKAKSTKHTQFTCSAPFGSLELANEYVNASTPKSDEQSKPDTEWLPLTIACNSRRVVFEIIWQNNQQWKEQFALRSNGFMCESSSVKDYLKKEVLEDDG
tara:strand:+ start:6851 stop:7210 length:360 start_codon:yes stop_codon:yes gene_type:complete